MAAFSRLEMPLEWMKMDITSFWDVSDLPMFFARVTHDQENSSLHEYTCLVGDIYVLYTFSSGTSADIMKVGGYKLSALEIEAVLLEAKISSFLCFSFQNSFEC